MATDEPWDGVKPPQPMAQGRALAQGWSAKFLSPFSSSSPVFRTPQCLSQVRGLSLFTSTEAGGSPALPLEGGVAPVGDTSAVIPEGSSAELQALGPGLIPELLPARLSMESCHIPLWFWLAALQI